MLQPMEGGRWSRTWTCSREPALGETVVPWAMAQLSSTCEGFLPSLRAMSCTRGARSSAGLSLRCSMYAVAGQLEAITCRPCAQDIFWSADATKQ